MIDGGSPRAAPLPVRGPWGPPSWDRGFVIDRSAASLNRDASRGEASRVVSHSLLGKLPAWHNARVSDGRFVLEGAAPAGCGAHALAACPPVNEAVHSLTREDPEGGPMVSRGHGSGTEPRPSPPPAAGRSCCGFNGAFLGFLWVSTSQAGFAPSEFLQVEFWPRQQKRLGACREATHCHARPHAPPRTPPRPGSNGPPWSPNPASAVQGSVKGGKPSDRWDQVPAWKPSVGGNNPGLLATARAWPSLFPGEGLVGCEVCGWEQTSSARRGPVRAGEAGGPSCQGIWVLSCQVSIHSCQLTLTVLAQAGGPAAGRSWGLVAAGLARRLFPAPPPGRERRKTPTPSRHCFPPRTAVSPQHIKCIVRSDFLTPQCPADALSRHLGTMAVVRTSPGSQLGPVPTGGHSTVRVGARCPGGPRRREPPAPGPVCLPTSCPRDTWGLTFALSQWVFSLL